MTALRLSAVAGAPAAASRRNLVAGILTIVFGAAVLLEGRHYGMGTLGRMGPGLYPTLLGGVLVVVGALIVATRGAVQADEHEPAAETPPDWRGWSCIIAGVAAFIGLGEYFGLAPATFGCVFVSAYGDRTAKRWEPLALALGTTVFAALVFSYGLKFQLPLFR